MNNDQFRRLIASTPKQQDGRSPPTNRPSATPTVLGARKHSSIPMTPRNVGGKNNINAEFARQLAERNAKANPAKRFKSSAPKGVKLAAGFVDRAQERKAKPEQEEEDERAERIKALEEAMKLGQIEREEFEKLVEEITGGELESTHLVKGLDRRLLDRVRQGEDVFTKKESPPREEEAGGEDIDSDAEFEELEKKDVETVKREKAEKKGEMAPPAAKPAAIAGVKRTRADILAELKAQRKAAAEAAEAERQKLFPSLGAGFRKVGIESTRIERDGKGREILVITDASGKEKRKVRKQKVEETLVPTILDDAKTHAHHMVLPATKLEEEEEDDGDIFEGIGSNFNPLADLEGSDSSSDEDEEGAESKSHRPAKTQADSGSEDGEVDSDSNSEPEIPATTSQKATASSKQPILPRRNWFKDDPTTSAAAEAKSSADATVLAALRKVRDMDASSSLLADTEEARLAKRAAELAARDRDMDDIDMGFGGSRFDDAEDMEREGEKVKFSEWKGLGAEQDDDDGDGKQGKGGEKRKRGPKKKKGDKNSATDILQAMERQGKAKTLG